MAKEETIKYLTELMATVQMAYFKGRLGERNTEATGGDGAICGELWVHEKEHGDAGIAIDLHRFGGDGKPVCDGLKPCTVTFDDGTESTGWLFCMFYDPDDVTPLSFAFDQYNCPDISIDPDCVPEDVLKNVTAWLEGVFQRLPVTVKYRILQITQHEGDARYIKFSSVDELRRLGLADKVTLGMYGTVYEGEAAKTDGWLDGLFVQFQGSKPEGYMGHSLSVSDIIEADGHYYYCDSFGWTEVTVSDGKIVFPEEKE